MDTEGQRLDLISAIGSQDSYLAVVSTLRSDGSPHSSVVNAAVVAHPVTGVQVGAFVTYGPVKLAHLRRRPSLGARDGPGSASMAPPNSPARTIGCPVLTRTTSRVCSGPSSPPRAGSTPTGTPTTASWPNRAVSPSWSTRLGSTPTPPKNVRPVPRRSPPAVRRRVSSAGSRREPPSSMVLAGHGRRSSRASS